MDGKNRKCAIYARVSGKKQANSENAHGIEMQIQACEAMAMIKDYEIIDIYTDRGVSGVVFPRDRASMSQMIIDSQAKKFETIIIYSFDRLSRHTRMLLDTIDYLESIGITISSCREQIDTSMPTGKFMLTVFSGLATLERENIFQKLKDARAIKREKEGKVGGRVPYGYSKINGKIEVNEFEKNILIYIFEQKYKNKTSKSIIEMLNSQEIPSPGGKKWLSGTISKILQKKDNYLGGTMYGGNVNWPQIIDDKFKNCTLTTKYKKTSTEEVKTKPTGINMDYFDMGGKK